MTPRVAAMAALACASLRGPCGHGLPWLTETGTGIDPMIAFQYVRHLLLAAGLLCASLSTLADDGDADALFGNQGRAIHSWPASTIQAETNAVAAGTDGSVFVAGWLTYSAPGQRDTITLLRFRPDGVADASFGNAGVALFDIDPASQIGESAVGVFALGSGRSLILAKRRVAGNMGAQPVLISVRGDGTPDPAFGTNGVHAIDISRWAGSDLDFSAARMAVDGRIVIAGSIFNDDIVEVVAARILQSGELDATFGDQGWTRIGTDERIVASSMTLDDLGRIVIAGRTLGDGTDDRPIVARLGTNGVPDPAFGDGGLVRADTGFTGDWSADAVVSGIRTIAGGFLQRRLFVAISRTSPRATGILGLTANGSIATTFGTGGFVDLSLEEGSRITALAMRRDQRLVAAGWIDPNGTGRSDFLVARMAFDGTLDTTFDGNGLARYPINADGDTSDTPTAMVLSGERPVIAGRLYNNNTPSYHSGVLRLTSDLIFRHGLE